MDEIFSRAIKPISSSFSLHISTAKTLNFPYRSTASSIIRLCENSRRNRLGLIVPSSEFRNIPRTFILTQPFI